MVERFWPKPDMDVAPDGPFVRYSDYAALRAELEAVKREAVEALKPFANVPLHGTFGGPLVGAVAAYEDGSDTMKDGAYRPVHSFIGHEPFRAARAFMEKHG